MTARRTNASEPRFFRRGLQQRVAFGLCVAILAVAVGLLRAGREVFGVYTVKEPVNLRKPLDMLEKERLKPYRFVKAIVLPAEVVEQLGTEQYIQWVLEDPRRRPDDPLRMAYLFVTYYTGKRFRVAHTPERCYLGGGYEPKSAQTVQFEVPGLDGKPIRVPARVVRFAKSSVVEAEPIVVYTFYVNCRFECLGEWVRFRLNNIWLPRTFFSKVEVTFRGGMLDAPARLEPQQVTKAAEDLLRTVLPILMKDHWPREEDLKQSQDPAEG